MVDQEAFNSPVKGFRSVSIFLIIFMVLLLVTPVTSIVTNITTTSEVSPPGSEPEDTEEPTHATRGNPRVGEDEPNDDYDEAREIMTNPATIEGSISSGNHDWFRIDLEAAGNVDNLTVKVATLSGGAGTLFIYIYGWYNIDQDFDQDITDHTDWGPGKIDHKWLPTGEDELILMKIGAYDVGFPSSETTFASAFIPGWHFIRLSLQGSGTANYELYVDATKKLNPPGGSNQNPGRATTISSDFPPKKKMVDMDLDAFDWYKISSPDLSLPGSPEGVNFSIEVDLEASLPGQTEVIGSETVDFFTELIMIILHEGPVDDTYRKSAVKKASIQYSSDLPREIEFFEVKALPEGEPFEKTYIGFYCQTYGVSREDPNNIWHGTGSLGNGWVKYSVLKVSVLPVYRPKLLNPQVISSATETEWGRSYDEYEYSVKYYQKNNYYPHVLSVTINGKDTRKLIKDSSKSYNDLAGVRYYYLYSGLMLGEGIYHTYQFHCWDRTSYAIGSVELGTTNYGPYVSNNLKPFVKPTALRNYTITEDSDPEYLSLNEIFEDAENDSLVFSIWNMTSDELSVVYDSENIVVSIINNSILEFAPKINMSGIEYVQLTVSDGNYTLTPALNFTVTIESVNDPPINLKRLGTINIQEDEVYEDINLNDYFIDTVEETKLDFYIAESFNVNIDIASNGKVTITPHENWYGEEKITFKANDGYVTITDVLTIVVHPVNDPPFLEFDELFEVNQSQWSNITFYANDSADGDILTFESNILTMIPELSTNSSKYRFNFNSTEGKITFFTTNELVGEYCITVKVKDPFGHNDTKMLTLRIINVNDKPIVKILSPLNGDAFLTSDKITFIGDASDPDDDHMTYIWSSNIDGEIGTSLVRKDYTLTEGKHNVTLSAIDSEGAISNYTISIRIFKESPLDTDGDGIFDYWEYILKLDPMDSRDSDRDPDGDGYTNKEEFYGNDGSPYGDDSTDPWNPDEHPSEHISEEDEFSGRMLIYIGLLIVLIVVMVFLVLLTIVRGKKERGIKEKREQERDKKKAGTQFQKDMYGIDQGIESQYGAAATGGGPEVRCHKCGVAIPVTSPHRPVVIHCNECETRGVVYE